jgi:hypothetical protein
MKRFLSSLLASFTKSSNRGGSLARQRRTRLGLECLEGRELMSVTSTAMGGLWQGLAADARQENMTVENPTFIPQNYATYPYYLQINSEIVRVDALAITGFNPVDLNFSVTRAIGGTPLTSHVAGATVLYLSGYQPQQSTPTTPATPPGVPANFTARGISTTQVSLNWSGVSGASGYLVYEVVNGAWQRIGVTGATNYVVPNLNPGTTYTFDVAAYNAAGGGQGAPPQSATTLTAALGAPTGLVARTASSTQVNLYWNGVAGATGYVIAAYTPSTGWRTVGTVSTTSCAVPRMDPGSYCYFQVAAYNAGGVGAYTGVVSALTTPAAPVFNAQAVSTSQVTLSWSPVAGAAYYLVEEYINGAWRQVGNALPAGTRACTVSNLGISTYYFLVVAGNASGLGAYPMWKAATT